MNVAFTLLLCLVLSTIFSDVAFSKGCSILEFELKTQDYGEFLEVEKEEHSKHTISLRQAGKLFTALKKKGLLFEENEEGYMKKKTSRWSEKTQARISALTVEVELFVFDPKTELEYSLTLELFGKDINKSFQHTEHSELVKEIVDIIAEFDGYKGGEFDSYINYLGGGGVVLETKRNEDFFLFRSMGRETYRKGGYEHESISGAWDAEEVPL